MDEILIWIVFVGVLILGAVGIGLFRDIMERKRRAVNQPWRHKKGPPE